MNDEQLRSALRRIDHPEPLSSDARDRLRSRMLARYDEAADVATVSGDGAVVVDLAPDDRATERDPSRLLFVAAVVALVLGALGIVWATAPGDDSDPLDGHTGTTAPTIDPTAVLGFEPFTTYFFEATDPDNPRSPFSILTLRAGVLDVGDDGGATLSVRLQLDGGPAPTREPVALIVDEAGQVVGPIEVLDPDSGCQGGALPLGPIDAERNTTVDCDGTSTPVTATTATGPAGPITLADGRTVTAVPVTTTLDGLDRTATWWFDATGAAVRLTLSIDGVPLDFDPTP